MSVVLGWARLCLSSKGKADSAIQLLLSNWENDEASKVQRHHFPGMLVRTRQHRSEAESKSMLSRADLCPWLMEEPIFK